MILITGTTGFVGSYLAMTLTEKGHKLHAIFQNKDGIQRTKDLFNLFEKSHLFSKITWIEADITDIPALEIAFENIDFVYHCASKTSFDSRDEKLLRKINIEGTANVVNMCLAKNIKKICFLSSVETLGDFPHSSPSDSQHPISKIITESSEWNPEKANSDFAISKYGAEMEIWRGQQEGLQVVIVNPGTILGAVPKSWNRDNENLRLISNITTGGKFYAQGSTGFVSVQDAVSCMINLMESSITGNRYILVAENLSFKHIANLIADASKISPPRRKLQKWVLELSLVWNWIKANLLFQKRTLFRANVEWLNTTKVYSNEKIKAELKFNFEPIKEVILKTIEKN